MEKILQLVYIENVVLLDQLAKYQIKPNIHETNFTYVEAQKDVANVLENVEQVDAVVGATD